MLNRILLHRVLVYRAASEIEIRFRPQVETVHITESKEGTILQQKVKISFPNDFKGYALIKTITDPEVTEKSCNNPFW